MTERGGTTPSDNVRLVRSVFPDRIDVPAMVDAEADPGEYWDAFGPDFEAAFVPDSPNAETLTYKGPDGYVQGWRDWLEAWESYESETEEIVEVGDRVGLLVRFRGRTHTGGVEIEHASAAVVTVRDAKIVSVLLYLDSADGLRELGLAAE
jgi:ketosteroid isomerase-like protein